MYTPQLEGKKVYLCTNTPNVSYHEESLIRHGASIVRDLAGEKSDEIFVFVVETRYALNDRDLYLAFTNCWKKINICTPATLEAILQFQSFDDPEIKKELENKWRNNKKRQGMDYFVSEEEIEPHNPIKKVWAWRMKDNEILAWPALKEGSVIYLVGIESFVYENISPYNQFSLDDIRVDPEHEKQFKAALEMWNGHPGDLNKLLANALFDNIESNGIQFIKSSNLQYFPNLDDELNDFLSKTLILIKKKIRQESETSKTICKILEKQVRTFQSLDKSSPSKCLEMLYTSTNDFSILFSLFNYHLFNTSEMNHQEMLSPLYSHLISVFNGCLQSKGNTKMPNGCVHNFFASYLKPDKILYLTLKGIEYCWPCFVSQHNPGSINEVWKHSDFKKVIGMMKCSLKDLIVKLMQTKTLNMEEEFIEYGFLTFSELVFVVKMTADSTLVQQQESKKYGCLYSTSIYGPYNVSIPKEAAFILEIVIEMAKYWEKMEKLFRVLPKMDIESPSTFLSTPEIASTISASSDLLTLVMKLADFYDYDIRLKSNISSTEAVALINNFCKLSFPSLENAQTKVEEIISTTTNQNHSITFKKLKQTKVERYAWLFELGRSTPIDLGKEGNKCLILVMVKDEQSGVETVYYSKVILENATTDNSHLFGSQGNVTKSKSLERDCFEEMGLFIPEDRIILNEIRKSSSGLGTFKNKTVYYKVDESCTNNFLVMNKMKSLKSEYLCEIYLHSEFKSKNDWCLTVMESLWSLKDITCHVSSEMRGTMSLQLFHDILMGLKTLHQNKIIHCDVSFGNVMYYWDDNKLSFRAKLIDFNNSFNMEYPRKKQIIKLKDPYTPEDGALTEYHDLYASALTFCRIVCELVEKKKMKASEEDDFVDVCIQTLYNCKDDCIISVYPLVQQILNGELKSVQQVAASLEAICKKKCNQCP